MAKSHRTSNDQRATVKNPTSKEYKMDSFNTSQQNQKNHFGKKAGFVECETDNSFMYLKDGELYFRFLI